MHRDQLCTNTIYKNHLGSILLIPRVKQGWIMAMYWKGVMTGITQNKSDEGNLMYNRK
jgi:hypothetical protein